MPTRRPAIAARLVLLASALAALASPGLAHAQQTSPPTSTPSDHAQPRPLRVPAPADRDQPLVIHIQVDQPYIDNIATRVTYDGWDRVFGIEWRLGQVSGRLIIPDAAVTEEEIFSDILDQTNAGVSVPEKYTPLTAPRLLPYLLAVRTKWGRAFDDNAHASMGIALVALVTTVRPSAGPVVAPTIGAAAKASPPKSTSAPSLPPARASPATPSAVWSRPPVIRGREIESALGANLPANFPTIDKLESRVVTSIKSLDLGSKTYQRAGALQSRVKGYIDKVARFEKAKSTNVIITPDKYDKRALELAIPSAGSAAQQAVLKELVAYGQRVGVEVTIIVY